MLLGHSRSIWLNFKGGKSAATVFGVVLAVFRIVSLSSILAALTAIALVFGFEQPMPYRVLVIAGSIYVILRHHANIQRLLSRSEPRLGNAPQRRKRPN